MGAVRNTSTLTSVGEDRAGDGRAIAVLDGEVAVLLGGRGRGGSLVLVLRRAGVVGAVARRHPEVGGAGVEVDDELLCGGADGDRARPLRLLLVVERLALALREEAFGDASERLDFSAKVESVRADVLLEVDQVLAVLAREEETAVSDELRVRMQESRIRT